MKLGPKAESPTDFDYISVAGRTGCLYIFSRWGGHPELEVGIRNREFAVAFAAPAPYIHIQALVGMCALNKATSDADI